MASSRRGEVVLSGYLTKSPPESRSAVSQWRRRWFVLADSKLVYPLAARYVRFEYYSSEEDAKSLADPKGVINLQVCNKVVSREPFRGHKHVFDVCTSDRVYHLNAESAEEKDEWIRALCTLLFGGENQQSSASGSAGTPPPFPLASQHSQNLTPPSPVDLYVANSTYSEQDFSGFDAASSNARDAHIQSSNRPLPPPPAPRRDGKRHSVGDETMLSLSTPKEDSRKHSAPYITTPQQSGRTTPSNGVEDLKKPKQPPKVVPYQQHKKVIQPIPDYEAMDKDDDNAPPPPPKHSGRKSVVQDDEMPPIVSKKKSPAANETKPELKYIDDSEYSYLQASPPRNDISDDYSHLDLSSAANSCTQSNKPKCSSDDDDYSHLSH